MRRLDDGILFGGWLGRVRFGAIFFSIELLQSFFVFFENVWIAMCVLETNMLFRYSLNKILVNNRNK